MLAVGGSPAGMRDVIPIEAGTGKQTCTAVDPNKTERWVYWPNGGMEYPQMFQFTTPQEAQPNDRCGKVVFSDMHVSGDSQSSSGTPFPERMLDGRPDAAGEGAGLHVLRPRELRVGTDPVARGAYARAPWRCAREPRRADTRRRRCTRTSWRSSRGWPREAIAGCT